LVFRRIRGILNKITPEKFEKLISDILNIIVSDGSSTIFKGVILLIFEKALDEPKYSSMYAQLCKRLNENAPNLEPPESKITTFKRLLLSKCKDEFENRAAISSAYEKRGDLSTDEEEAKFLAKRKMLGNIKFIGELGKLEMLHDSILHRCCEQLLVGRRKQSLHDQTEDIECLAHLMKTCGRILDSAKAKIRMDQYFERIRTIIDNADTPTRIRFLLQDVCEMRNNKWMPRKLTSPDGPRTIQQVREDAARDGCIYLPQQDQPNEKPKANASNKLEQAIFSKSRPKGMEDIFGGPGDLGMNLGMGPGVIQGNENNSGGFNPNNGYNNNYDNNGYRGRNSGPSFEEKFKQNNSNYNNGERDYKDNNFKKRDSLESKYGERIDFGDRFTANRNKTHPANRGRGGREAGERRTSPQYETRNERNLPSRPGETDLPPRFNKMGFNNSDNRDSLPLRPSPNAMMLKPKTPYSLPKSAMAKLDSMNAMQSCKIDKVMMTSNEPAVIIQKPVSNAKKQQQDKKNQGPTREEVFGKVDQILEQLTGNSSTNEAFTSWKDINIPTKMVNNALIHLFKQIQKIGTEDTDKALEFIDQLFGAELVTGVQVRESLARLVSGVEGGAEGEAVAATAELAAWAVHTGKVKLAEIAEMTEGGGSHPLFLVCLQNLAGKDKTNTLNLFKESNIKLTDQLPVSMRTEEKLGEQLEQRQLSFLVPLLAIKADMWRQLESQPSPSSFLSWILSTVPDNIRKEHSFISALVASIMRYISEATTLKDQSEPASTPEKDITEKEKEMIAEFKEILTTFVSTGELQLAAVYALQVFCFSRGFPKGMVLRWFVALYEADVVDEQVFLKWKEDVNDSYPGKGKALFQVNQWLTWLEEAESEEEDEDDEE